MNPVLKRVRNFLVKHEMPYHVIDDTLIAIDIPLDLMEDELASLGETEFLNCGVFCLEYTELTTILVIDCKLPQQFETQEFPRLFEFIAKVSGILMPTQLVYHDQFQIVTCRIAIPISTKQRVEEELFGELLTMVMGNAVLIIEAINALLLSEEYAVEDAVNFVVEEIKSLSKMDFEEM